MENKDTLLALRVMQKTNSRRVKSIGLSKQVEQISKRLSHLSEKNLSAVLKEIVTKTKAKNQDVK